MKRCVTLSILLLILVVLCSAFPSGAARFVDIGESMNLPPAYGGAWGDFNNDGYPDLYIDSYWLRNPPMLLQNHGDGTFTDVAAAMGLPTTPQEDWGCAWGDYNNDGKLDLVVSGGTHNSVGDGSHRVYLFRNDGDHFTEVGQAAGLIPKLAGRGVAWGDYDRDNWLDLYVCYQESNFSYLYHNNQDGTFTEVSNAAGMGTAPAGNAAQASWADANNDGWIDLAVVKIYNFIGAPDPARLYMNNHNGTFYARSFVDNIESAYHAVGIAWGDYNNDGFLDSYMTSAHGHPGWFYRNNGNGTFDDVYAQAVGGVQRKSFGVAWADYDNDSLLDFTVANEAPPNFLWHNNGDGTFTDQAVAEGMDLYRTYLGVCWADYDRDGRLDLFASVNHNEIVNSGTSCIFRNTGSSGNYLRVRALTDRDGDATDSNTADDRDALSARVEVNLDNDVQFPSGRTIVRLIDGGSSYMSQNEPIAHFGVGAATTVAVRAIFPDGAIVVQANVPVNQQITLRDAAQTFGSVTGTVIDQATGLPVAGVAVSCGPIAAVTDANGVFVIPELAAGLTYAFTASGPGYFATTVRNIAVAAGQTTTANFTVQQRPPDPGSIGGIVLDASTWYPIAGATVSCAGKTATTDSNGTYVISNVSPGSDYTVTASATGYSPSEMTGVSVASNQTTPVDFALNFIPGTITGKIYDLQTKLPIEGALVYLDFYWNTTTGPDGRFAFTDMAPRTDYTFSVWIENYFGAWVYPVEIKAGQTTILDSPQVRLDSNKIK